MFLVHINVPSLVLITFRSIRSFSEVLVKFRNPSFRIQDGLHLAIMTQLRRHMTLSFPIADLKGNISGGTICPPNLKGIYRVK